MSIGTAYMPVIPSVSGMGRTIEKQIGGQFAGAGKAAGKGISSGVLGAVKGLAGPVAGIFAAGKALDFFKDANAEAREAQKVGAVTSQVIKATGGAAKITSKQVGDLTSRISAKAGMDDEAIQSGANLLLTFKNVRNEAGKGSKIFDRATQSAVDLSAAGFGSVEGSSKMLGKALNDPIKGISALGRAGVTFSDQQKDQIKTLVTSGKTLEAQKIILGEVESQVGGVAEKSATAGEKMAVAFGNFKEQVGTALLPVIDRVETFITGKLIPGLSNMVTFLETNVGPGFAKLKGYVQPVIDTVSGFLSGLGGASGGGAAGFFTKIQAAAVPMATTFTTQILPVVKDIAASVLQFAQTAAPYLIEAFRGISNFIVTQVIPRFLAIQTTVAKLYATVLPIVRQIAGELMARFKEALPTIRATFTEVGTIITTVLGFVKSVISGVTTAITFIWSRWGGQITTIVGSVFKTVIGVISGALKIVSGVVKVATSLLTGDWAGAAAGLKKITDGIKQVFVSIFTNIGVQVKTLFGGLITSLVNKGISFTSWLGSTFKAGLSKVKEFILAPVRAARDGIGTVLGGIKTAFSNAVTAIGNIWDGLKEKAASPIRFVVNTVLKNGLVDAFDKVAGLLPGNLKIGDKISWPAFANGGIAFPGRYTPGRDIGYAAVSGGEPIMRPEFGRAVGHGTINAWNKAARTGGVGGVRKAMGGFMGAFAKGGIVSPTVSGKQNTSYGGHSGIDFFGRVGDVIRAASAGTIDYTGSGRGYGQAVFMKGVDGLSQVYGHTSSILVKVGQMVKAGMAIARVGYSGNVRPPGPAGAHLHFEVADGSFAKSSNRAFTQSWLRGAVSGGATTGGGVLDGLGDLVGNLKGKLTGPLGRLKELGGSPIAKLAAAAPPALAKAMIDKVRSSVPSISDVVTSVAGKFKAGAGVARWTPEVLKALGMTGQSVTNLPRTLRRMNQESGGNPSAINNWDINAKNGTPSKGLMQVIGPTFATYRDKSLSSNIYDPLANIVASMRYALATYGSLARAYDKSGGYAKGTTNATKGMHWVGENGPELRMFSGGETVIPSKQSFQIAGLAQMMQGGGRQFVDGMIAGVASGSPAFQSAAQAMAAGGVDAVRAELQIASPSKVMQQIGVYFSEGFIKGLTGSSSAVKSAVTALATQAAKAFEAKGSGKKSGLVEKYSAEVKRLKPLAQSRASVLKSIGAAEKKLTTARKSRPSSAALAELQGKVKTAKKKGKGVAAAEAALQRAKAKRALPGELETQISQLRKAAKGGAKYRKQLASAEKKLASARKLDPGGNATKQGQAFAKKFAKQTAALAKNAKDRESAASKIKAAQDKVKEATQARTDFAAGVKGQVTESSSIALSGIVQASQVTDTLKARLGRWKSFISDMAKLKKLGLGNAAYQQLVSAGPEAGGSVARALLAGGKSSITEVNSLQKQFDTIGTSFGKTSSTVLFQPGVDAANGFLKGFQDQEKKLTAAGTKLAKALAKAVKQELGIKSPSKVFRAVGLFSGEGLVDGLEASQAAVARAGAGMAYAAIQTPATASTSAATAAGPDGYVRTLTQSGNVYLGYNPDEIRKAEEKRDRRSARKNNLQGV